MFFEVLSPIHHSPITIESLNYRVLLVFAFRAGAAQMGHLHMCRHARQQLAHSERLSRGSHRRRPAVLPDAPPRRAHPPREDLMNPTGPPTTAPATTDGPL